MAACRPHPLNSRPHLLLAAACASLVLAAPSCDQSNGTTPGTNGAKSTQPAGVKVKKETVKIAGKSFKLELALDDKTRYKGLSDRTEIAENGGMLFVFAPEFQTARGPQSGPKNMHFVMRDCPIPIDIIFLDASGRITAMHAMVPDPPRAADERKEIPAEDRKYNDRLTKYPSKHAAQFVIELKGGTLPSLDLKEGERIPLDTKRLLEKCLEAEKAEDHAAAPTNPAGGG